MKKDFKEKGQLDSGGVGSGIVSRMRLIQNWEVIELGKKESDIRKERSNLPVVCIRNA